MCMAPLHESDGGTVSVLLASTFRGSEQLAADDSMSLAASNVKDPGSPPPKESGDVQPSVDSELIHILTKAVEEHGLSGQPQKIPPVDTWMNGSSQGSARTTSALAGRAYSAAGQAGSALYTMAVLQVFQAKLLQAMDQPCPDPTAFRQLGSVTDLALCTIKITAQAIGQYG